MNKEKLWIHLWGQTFIPKTNLLVVLGIMISMSFVAVFTMYNTYVSSLSFLLMLAFMVLFIIVARRPGLQH
jgi:hypothetical protein